MIVNESHAKARRRKANHFDHKETKDTKIYEQEAAEIAEEMQQFFLTAFSSNELFFVFFVPLWLMIVLCALAPLREQVLVGVHEC
jgi:hypothetical protein